MSIPLVAVVKRGDDSLPFPEPKCGRVDEEDSSLTRRRMHRLTSDVLFQESSTYRNSSPRRGGASSMRSAVLEKKLAC